MIVIRCGAMVNSYPCGLRTCCASTVSKATVEDHDDDKIVAPRRSAGVVLKDRIVRGRPVRAGHAKRVVAIALPQWNLWQQFIINERELGHHGLLRVEVGAGAGVCRELL